MNYNICDTNLVLITYKILKNTWQLKRILKEYLTSKHRAVCVLDKIQRSDDNVYYKVLLQRIVDDSSNLNIPEEQLAKQ